MSGKRKMRRGLYLLPTLFTLANLFCGFLALLWAADGKFVWSAVLILVAGILDGLDGRIARLTGTSSEFGRQFDSLADLVSFGLAPACLSYFWSLQSLDRLGLGIAFLFLVCAGLRLARFNLVGSKDRKDFIGLPSPAGAGALAAAVYAFEATPDPGAWTAAWATFHVAIALLMISRFRYRSFKDFDLRSRRSLGQAIPLALGLWGLIFSAPLLLIVATGYLIWAPIQSLRGRLRGSRWSETVDQGGRG